ncbi:hypothetical protein [Luteimonas sp. e5]
MSTAAQPGAPLRQSSPMITPRRGRTPAASLDSETIAADIAAFKKRGGRIDVLGNTPLRPNISPYRSRASEARAAAAAKKTASKAANKAATKRS